MTRTEFAMLSRRSVHVLSAALLVVLSVLKEIILIVLILSPIVISFAIGVLFAIGVRMVYAAREGFKDGQKLING